MSVNINKLKGKIVEANLTQEGVASTIGIDRSTFYRKMQDNGLSFSIEEVHGIVKALSLTNEEAIEIFFSRIVA